MLNAQDARTFILSGNATITLVSKETGNRYTYKVRAFGDKPNFFSVGYLRGSNNENDFTYIGVIDIDGFRTTQKSRLPASSGPVRAFAWSCSHILAGAIPGALEVWHEGKCGMCGRPLTVPESIARGLGPTCAQNAAWRAEQGFMLPSSVQSCTN
jgi:hypothetical protein